MYPRSDLERCPDDGSLLYVLGSEGPTQRPWGVGDTISNKYLLIEELEKKVGTGRSFKAEQLRLKRIVELRLLSNDGMMKPGEQARFEREVSVWSKVRSPYIVRLYDFGFTERDEPYITLEFTAKGTLKQLIQRRGYMSYEEGLRLSTHILEALDTAHSAQVLHRNVNPDAIVLHTLTDGQDYYRLTGFAVAKLMGDVEDDPTAITMTGQVICDPAYMAPESIMMGILEPKTDLYALGVTLYEAFTGQRPFPGESLSELLGAHVHGTYTPIESHRPDIPVILKKFLTRLLHHDPNERFSSAREALEVLKVIIDDFGEHAMNATITGEFKPLKLKKSPLDRLSAWFKALFMRRRR